MSAPSHDQTSLPQPLRNNYWLLRHGRSLANEAEIIVSSLENGIQQKWSLSPTGLLQAQAAGHLLRKQLSKQHTTAPVFPSSAALKPVDATLLDSLSIAAPLSVTATAEPAASEADAAVAQRSSTFLLNISGAAPLCVTPFLDLLQEPSASGNSIGAPESQPSALHFVYTSPFSRTVLTAQTAAGVAGMCTTGSQFRECVDLRERFFGSVLELQPYAAAYGQIWEHDELSAESHPGGGDGESVKHVAARLQLMFQRLEEEHHQGGLNILLVSHGDTLSILQAAMTGSEAQLGHHRRFAFETAELRRL